VKRYHLVFTPEAVDQLISIERFLTEHAGPATGQRFADELVRFCESLQYFPDRCVHRDDLRPGLRIATFKKRVVIAFAVRNKTVSIVRIFYAGQNYETALGSGTKQETEET